MSVRVQAHVYRSSSSVLAARLVLLALADAASDDGVTWLGQPEIAAKAKVSVREVRRSVRDLEEMGELETRKAQRGRRRINVYRVRVGHMAAEPIDYDRLPFVLNAPFTVGQIVRSSDGSGADAGVRPPRADDRTQTTVTTGRSRTRAELRTISEPTSSNELGADAPGAVEQKANRKRSFDELWEALTEVGLPPSLNPSARSAHAELVWVLVDAGASPADVRARATAYRKHETLGRAMFTLPALTKHWHALDGALPVEDATRLHLAALAQRGHA